MKLHEWIATAAVAVGIAFVVDFVVDATVPASVRAFVVIPIGVALVLGAAAFERRVTARRKQEAAQRNEG